MKRTALTGVLAAGLILMPAQQRAQTNPPQPQVITECELGTMMIFGGLVFLEVVCIIESAFRTPTNGDMTSAPPPDIPPWTNTPPVDPPPTNAPPPSPKLVLQVKSAVSIPITDGSMLDTNGPATCPFTNYLAFAMARGDDVTTLRRAYEFRVWQSPLGNLIHMTDEAGNQLWGGYTLHGQTNRVPVYLDSGRAPKQFFTLLSE